MSGLKSRNKGKGYEYEIARELYDQLGITFVRELDQTREKHLGDLVTNDCDFPFVLAKPYYQNCAYRPWDYFIFLVNKLKLMANHLSLAESMQQLD